MSQPKEDSVLPERNTIAVLPITTQENNSPQEQDTNSSQVLPAGVPITDADLTIQQLPSSQWNL